MGRPIKKGVNHFRHDVYAINDRKLSALIRQHGAIGYAVYFVTLELIFREGDETIIDNAFIDQVADSLRLTTADVKTILDLSAKIDLFDPKAWKKKQLTSEFIAKTLKNADATRIAAKKRIKENRLNNCNGEQPKKNVVVRANNPKKHKLFDFREKKEKKEKQEKEKTFPKKEKKLQKEKDYLSKEKEYKEKVKKEKETGSSSSARATVAIEEEFDQIWNNYPANRRCNRTYSFQSFLNAKLDSEQVMQLVTALKKLPEAYSREKNRYLPTIFNLFQNGKWKELIEGFANKIENEDDDLENYDITNM